MSDVLIDLRDVEKAYKTEAGAVVALRRVGFRVKRGECVAIVGPSGSGKSTLLGVLGGLVRPDRVGHLEVSGHRWLDLNEAARSQARRRSIAFVHQALNLVGFMSVLDNVVLPLLMNGEPSGRATTTATAALHQLGLGDMERRRPQELSGGQQQRVAVARAMAAGQPVLLADEPTGALDTDTSRAVFTAIRDHARQRGAAVIVSHDPLVSEYADRTMRIVDGNLAAA